MSAAAASPLQHEQALVVFSGGQDSATCLAWALSRFQRVLTLGFDYGQRHYVELTCRERVRTALGSPHSALGATAGAGYRAQPGYFPPTGRTQP